MTDVLVVKDTRRAFEVTGADRASFLEATLSQRIDGRTPGSVVGALWLDIHGATQAVMDVFVEPDQLVLVVPDAHVSSVRDGLAMRTFLSQATFDLLDDVVVGVRGAFPGAPPAGQGLLAGDVRVLGRPDGVDLVGSPEAVAAWLADNDLPAFTDDLDLLRDHEVVHAVPRVPDEITGPQLPEELGLLPTHVHLAKGCYPGQEAVARMWMLGRPRRRLVSVALESGRPAAGDEAGAGRQRWTVTRVTSEAAVEAHALVLAPGDAAVGDRVEGEGWSGHVRQVVGADTAQPGADPGVTRRRDRPAGERGNRLPG